MQFIYNGDTSTAIDGGRAFVSADGTQYGADWDKATIPGMQALVNIPPEGKFKSFTSRIEMRDGIPTVVYVVTNYTESELEAIAASDARAIVQSAIVTLEATVTPRRIREAVTSDTGKSWLIAVSAAIAVERAKL